METVITMQGIFFILWTLSIYLFKRLINDMDERIKNNETEIKEIKENYIGRFEDVREKINQSEKLLLEKIHRTEINIISEIAKLKNNGNADN